MGVQINLGERENIDTLHGLLVVTQKSITNLYPPGHSIKAAWKVMKPAITLRFSYFLFTSPTSFSWHRIAQQSFFSSCPQSVAAHATQIDGWFVLPFEKKKRASISRLFLPQNKLAITTEDVANQKTASPLRSYGVRVDKERIS